MKTIQGNLRFIREMEVFYLIFAAVLNYLKNIGGDSLRVREIAMATVV